MKIIFIHVILNQQHINFIMFIDILKETADSEKSILYLKSDIVGKLQY